MSITGVKPKPTNLKLLEGITDKSRLNENEPKLPTDNIVCPNWLLDDAKLEWQRVASILETLGILTEVDTVAFAGYCQSYAKWKKAEEFLKEHGTTYRIPKKDKTGKVVSVYIAPFPEVAIARACLEQVRQFCAEFGLTPSSRGRIQLPGDNEGDLMKKHLASKR